MCRANFRDIGDIQGSVEGKFVIIAPHDPTETNGTCNGAVARLCDGTETCNEVRRQQCHGSQETSKCLVFHPYGEEEFRKHSRTEGLGIGLCAGLVRFWASERRHGRDPIEQLRRPNLSLIRSVIIFQLQSVYFKMPPVDLRSLTQSKTALITFKYGSVSAFEDLLMQRNTQSMLELDLALHHDMSIIQQWHLTGTISGIVAAFGESPHSGLYLFLIRYWVAKKRISGEEGHRTALIIEEDGVCRFYDSRRGEVTFGSFRGFLLWFMDYWNAEQWEYFLRRGHPPDPPLRIVHLAAPRPDPEGGYPSLEDLSTANLPKLEDLEMWLTRDLARDIAAVLNRRADLELIDHP
jgi:hypothetical protein